MMDLRSCPTPNPLKLVFISLTMLCLFFVYVTYNNHGFKGIKLWSNEAEGNCSCQCSDNKFQQPPSANIQQESEEDIIVLIWMWPFGFKHSLNCDLFNITGCTLTVNRSSYHQAHGVIFHHRDIRLEIMPTEPRPWFQKWIWFDMESPANSHLFPSLDDIFNLTISYRLDSTIIMPYGKLERLQPQRESIELPTKNKLVCWIVSHWEPQLKRVRYYEELKKYVNISLYGRAFGKAVAHSDYNDIVSSCKFYLSFENSVCKDYITEKLYRHLDLGSVPVVLGPPRKNYERMVPPNSFIHVDDFSSPKQLVERLLYLDRNNEEYLKLLEWKKRFKVVFHKFGHEAACKSCRYLQKNRGYQVFNNLNKWYWG